MNTNWVFKLNEIVKYSSGWTLSENYIYRDANKNDKIRMVITTDGDIYITPYYSWDGCSPKIFFRDIYIGTPDGIEHKDTQKPKTYYASLFHDALYQFYRKGGPYTIKDADIIFWKIMRKYEFKLTNVYYNAVRIFGKTWKLITDKNRKNLGTMEKTQIDHPDLRKIISQPSKPI